MAERPIIIRGGLSEALPDEPTMHRGSPRQTGLSLYVESKNLEERLEFIPNRDGTRWQLRNVATQVIEVKKGKIPFLSKKIVPNDGIFEVELDRDPDRPFRPPPRPVDNKIVLGIAAVGFVVWLLSRRS